MKKIAWGFSKLFQMHIERNGNDGFAYCVDSHPAVDSFNGIEVCLPTKLDVEQESDLMVIIFAVSNYALISIAHELASRGFEYGKSFIFYGDYFYKDYSEKIERELNLSVSYENYSYVRAYYLNSRKPIHTTLLGSHLFIELLKHTAPLQGAVAEVGAFEGGNIYCALNHPENINSDRTFYILDSFEGFGTTHKYDPAWAKSGDYSTKASYSSVRCDFSQYPQAKLIKGFVPDAFAEIRNDKFSLVFYDCDLYQPALDTFNFFWERIVPGGYLVIHDYICEQDGFGGVKQAVQEFFDKECKIVSFYENTMAVIQK